MKTIPLTQGYVAVVDDEDYEAVSAFKWHTAKRGQRIYAVRNICRAAGGGTQYLHRLLMPEADEVDHVDGDGRNNLRDNLRAVNRQQNLRGFQKKRLRTTSKFRGVCRCSWSTKWQAQIKVSGNQIHLGCFSFATDAARAYDAAAREHFGEFACPNFK